jgi:Aerotolerance regulator N-terminal
MAFSFLNLSGFFLALGIPLLMLAYLKQDRQKKLFVSSTILLSKLTNKRSTKRKLKLPFRFFVELLALLFLVMALANPIFKEEKTKIAIIVDNSLSMSAGSNTSRLEASKKELTELLPDFSSKFSFTVYQTSPTLKLIGENLSRDQTEEKIEKIKLSESEDNLSQAVQKILSETEFLKLLVLSDKKIAESEILLSKTEIVNLDSFRSTQNISIAEIKLEKIDGKQILNITSVLSGREPVEIEAKVFADTLNNKTLIGSDQLRIFPDKAATIPFSLPTNALGAIAYQVEISAVDSGFDDAIAKDNRGWIGPSAQATNQILVVSPELTPSVLGLNKITNNKFRGISPTEFSKLSTENLAEYSLVIFHKSAPAKKIKNPVLLILPPGNNAYLQILPDVTPGKITSWEEGHPLLSYLKISLLTLSNALVFTEEPWTANIIKAENGPVFVAGEQSGKRVTGIGFEILPYEGANSPLLSVLTLNSINWLSNQGNVSGTMKTGSIYALPENFNWQIVKPNNEILSLDSTDSTALELDSAGIYLLSGTSLADDSLADSSLANGSKQNKVLVANAFLPEESATFKQQAISISRENTKTKGLENQNAPLWQIFIALCIIALIIDVFLKTEASKNLMSSVKLN